MVKRMFGKRSAWSALAACTGCLMLSARVEAEAGASQKAAAESLWDDGVRAMKAGHYADACPKLEESERIDPGIGTLLYLGECYERIGRTASAWAIFREAASTAQAQGETERSRIAAARADRLQAGLSKLTVRVAPETAQLSSLRVMRDNAQVSGTVFGVAIPVDPGKYHIVASADGYESVEADVEVAASGDSKTVDIPSLKAAPKAGPAAVGLAPVSTEAGTPATPTAASAPPVTEAQPPASSGLQTAAYVTGSLGVVALGVGSYFGIRAISKNSDAKSHCQGQTCRDTEGPSLTSQAKNAAVASNITLAVGAALVVTGVVLYLSREPKREARLELHPLMSRDLAGIGFGGAFR